MDIVEAGSERRLPVWAVAKRSYAYVWERRALLAFPLLLVFLAQLLSGLYIQRTLIGIASPSARVGWIYLTSFAVILFSMSVIVGIHRTVLLDDIRRGIGFLRWDSNLLRYVGTWLTLGLVTLLIVIVLGIGIGIGATVTGMAGSYRLGGGPTYIMGAGIFLVLGLVLLRFMLALPAAAVGAPDRLGLSWKATRGNWLRLLAVAVLTALPFIFLNFALAIPSVLRAQDALKSGAAPESFQQPLDVLVMGAMLRAIYLAVLTVMLSLSYDVLVRGGGPAAAPHERRDEPLS